MLSRLVEKVNGERIIGRVLSPHVIPAYRWDALAGLLGGIYMGAIFPFVMRIARADLHASRLEISLLTAAPFLGSLLAPLWARQMVGRSKMPFCVYSWTFARALFFGMFLVTQAWQFVLLIGMAQIIGSISGPAYTALMKDIYPDEERGRAMGLVRMGAYGALFVVSFIAGHLLDAGVPFRWVFPAAAMVGIAGAWCFSRVPVRESIATSEQRARLSAVGFWLQTVAILKHNRGFRWFAASVMTYGFGNLVAFTLYPLYQVDRLNITNVQVATLTNVASVSSIVAFAYWGHFMDRYGALWTALVNILIQCLMPIVYFFSGVWWHLVPASVVQGVAGAGIELAYLNVILTLSEEGKEAQYQALHSMLLGMRGTLAPFVAVPILRALGFDAGFMVCLALMLIGAYTQAVSLRAYRKRGV
ncbi:MAG: MFS transporter [Armatimonadota bacterium]